MSFISNIKERIPRPVRNRVGPLFNPVRQFAWRFVCPVCGRKVKDFLELDRSFLVEPKKNGSDLVPEQFETLNVAAYSCRYCEASDRERLYALYLEQRIGSLGPGATTFRMLDFAPGNSFSDYIRKRYRITYRTADFLRSGFDDRVDITDMRGYPDGSFDAFICSHVLEHVSDDNKAMRELYRILRPGGWGILMVPLSKWLVTNDVSGVREDFTKVTEAERWKYFGQGDHVRLYGKSGWVSRLRAAGFQVLELGKEFFGEDAFARAGIAEGSILYVGEKPAGQGPETSNHRSLKD